MKKLILGTLISSLAGTVVGCSGSSSNTKPDSGTDSRPTDGGAGGRGAGSGGNVGSGGAVATGGAPASGVGGAGDGGMTGTGGTAGTGAGGEAVDSGPIVYPPATTCAGYAARFGGAASVTIPRPIQDDMTIEAWIRTSVPSTTGLQFWNGTPVVYADLSGTHNDFGTSILNDHFAFGLGVIPLGADQTVEGTSTVTTGVWVHVAATRNRTTGMVQVFVNGVVEKSGVLANTSSLTDNAGMTIGANLVDFRYFAGDIDEVRLWTVVRSPAEIAASMNARLTGTEPGLVGYWRFDEAGMSPIDRSGAAAAATTSGLDWAPSEAPVCSGPPDASVPSDGATDGGTDGGIDSPNNPDTAPGDAADALLGDDAVADTQTGTPDGGTPDAATDN